MSDLMTYSPVPIYGPSPSAQFNQANIHSPILKVLGLGGGGQNAVDRMIELGLSGVQFIAANTDVQALQRSHAPLRILLGLKGARGLGAGGDPEVGRRAALESYKQLQDALEGADMVFITAGMGGGTGTGSIPVAARIARATGAVTIAIVTTPFSFENGRRSQNAREGIARLRNEIDTLIEIPNDRLLIISPREPLDGAFRMADDALRQAVQGITTLITSPKYINVDFANIHHLIKLGGGALMSSGRGEGENKLRMAIDRALHHPLLNTSSINKNTGILVNFTSGADISLLELNDAVKFLHDNLGKPTETVIGIAYDERLHDDVEVILIATGLGSVSIEEAIPGYVPAARKTETPAPSRPEVRRLQTSPPKDDVNLLEYNTEFSANDLETPTFMRQRCQN